MSRIGKKPVSVPSGVTATVEGQTVKVKGPKGAVQLVVHDDVIVALDKGMVKIDPRNDSKRARSMWGTYRTLVSNLVTGVTKGFEEKLEITGVGDRAAVQGKSLNLDPLVVVFALASHTTSPSRSRKESRLRRRSLPKSTFPASTSRLSGRSPRKSAVIVRRNRTRARA